ncbi:DUF916 and DUF3324 domain-containing protein [Candidatus Enterococcus mansonii]|uniref:Uncharacterized protein n=1 Tax=Candidatus Enterococcus mansonii TaxID=1834181 RepID=A0A242CCE9_9ENTE|nr:DUF916 and DUF3324 domain-containing protein [Enterococcus sp. 4G2_DIV0659]OTO07839.1 hypothetical protein A5880_002109 [Enterococcus sp. 4G2_DIV0659]
MKQQSKPAFFLLIYIICTLFVIPQETYANEQPSPADIGFSYYVRKPENQHSDAGYFDLRMTPSQKQTVNLEVFNDSDRELTIELALNSAKTNSNGVVEYGPTEIKNDPSLKYDVKDIVKVPSEVKVAAHSSVMVPVEITMPAERFNGYISGGIQLKQKETEEQKKASEKSKGVVNKYAFLVGILLSETDEIVQPDLSFNKISAGLTNYRNAFLLNFSNTQMNYVEKMSVDVKVYKKGSDEVLYETKKANYRMAPNSMIDFPINLNGEPFEAGNYTSHILVTTDDKKWEWKEDFEVTNDEADKYNGQDVSLIQERGVNWKLIALIVSVVFILFIAVFSFVRYTANKKKKKNKKKKTSSKKKK